MRVTSYVAFALTCLVAGCAAAPVASTVLVGDVAERGPVDSLKSTRSGVLGSITNPKASAGNGNDVEGNGDGNGASALLNMPRRFADIVPHRQW